MMAMDEIDEQSRKTQSAADRLIQGLARVEAMIEDRMRVLEGEQVSLRRWLERTADRCDGFERQIAAVLREVAEHDGKIEGLAKDASRRAEKTMNFRDSVVRQLSDVQNEVRQLREGEVGPFVDVPPMLRRVESMDFNVSDHEAAIGGLKEEVARLGTSLLKRIDAHEDMKRRGDAEHKRLGSLIDDVCRTLNRRCEGLEARVLGQSPAPGAEYRGVAPPHYTHAQIDEKLGAAIDDLLKIRRML